TEQHVAAGSPGDGILPRQPPADAAAHRDPDRHHGGPLDEQPDRAADHDSKDDSHRDVTVVTRLRVERPPRPVLLVRAPHIVAHGAPSPVSSNVGYGG